MRNRIVTALALAFAILGMAAFEAPAGAVSASAPGLGSLMLAAGSSFAIALVVFPDQMLR